MEELLKEKEQWEAIGTSVAGTSIEHQQGH